MCVCEEWDGGGGTVTRFEGRCKKKKNAKNCKLKQADYYSEEKFKSCSKALHRGAFHFGFFFIPWCKCATTHMPNYLYKRINEPPSFLLPTEQLGCWRNLDAL